MNTRILILLGAISVLLMGCMTGSIEMGDPQWNPPIISKEGCPNLDGKYKALDNLLMRSLTQHGELSIDKNQLLVRQVSYRKIPLIPRDKEYFARLGVVGENAVRSAGARDEAVGLSIHRMPALRRCLGKTKIQNGMNAIKIGRTTHRSNSHHWRYLPGVMLRATPASISRS